MTAGGGAATVTVLVTGGRAGEREAAIAAALAGVGTDAEPARADLPGGQAALVSAAILEGLSDGQSALADLADSGRLPALQVLRIAPGCLCCAGNMILRVTLNRLLRRPPARLFISLADATHVEQLRLWLSSAPYDKLLRLEADIRVS
jgi:hypothetical protein